MKPAEALSYQIPKKDYDLYDEDFVKTMMHYLMFQNGIDVKSFADSVTNKVLFDSVISKEEDTVSITVKGVGESDG